VFLTVFNHYSDTAALCTWRSVGDDDGLGGPCLRGNGLQIWPACSVCL